MASEIVVITGAARGLGRALVGAFLDSGATVCGIVRSTEDLRCLKDSFGDAPFHGIIADVTDYDAVANAVQEIEASIGAIGCWFNNAAVYPKLSFLDETPEQFCTAMNANVIGVANCCKAVLAPMVTRNQGKIFNVGSWAHLGPISNSAAYSTSKGAVHVLTKSVAKDLAARESGVEIHEWIPGHLNTRMSDFTGIDPAMSAAWAVQIAQAEPSARSVIYENDHEWTPPLSLRQRIKSLLLFSGS